MITAVGQVATPRGLAERRDLAGTPDPFTVPAANYRHLQAAAVPVLVEHDDGFVVGTVAVLVRSQADGLLGVLRIDDGPVVELLADGPWYLSPGIRTRAGTRPLERAEVRLDEVSLTRTPATLGTRPLRWSRTDIATDGGAQPNGLPPSWRTAWDRAHATLQGRAYQRRASLRVGQVWIVDIDAPGPDTLDRQPRAVAQHRAAAEPVGSRVFRHAVGGSLAPVD